MVVIYSNDSLSSNGLLYMIWFTMTTCGLYSIGWFSYSQWFVLWYMVRNLIMVCVAKSGSMINHGCNCNQWISLNI